VTDPVLHYEHARGWVDQGALPLLRLAHVATVRELSRVGVRPVLDITDGVGTRLHVLRSWFVGQIL